MVSIMDASSTTSKEQAKGLFSFLPNPSSFGLNSSKRCMVFASTPLVSVMRFAARPVGAASNTFAPADWKTLIMAFKIVVFPVPGPPVSTIIFDRTAVFTALSCSSANSIFILASTASMLFSAFLKQTVRGEFNKRFK